MAGVPNTPPYQAHFLDANGRVAIIWYRYFTELQKAIISITGNEAVSEIFSGDGGTSGSSDAGSIYTDIKSIFDSKSTDGNKQLSKAYFFSSASYSATIYDEVLFADTDANDIEITLPIGVNGMSYKIINCGSNGYTVTVSPNGSEELYGAGAGVSSVLSDGENIDIHFYSGKGWY